MRLSTIPFPPVVIARSASCLIAESYISSNPAAGMVLISPPVSNQSLEGDLLPNKLPEFDYEPYFPIVVIDTEQSIRELKENNRICQDEDVETLSVSNLQNDSELLSVVEDWLERLGI